MIRIIKPAAPPILDKAENRGPKETKKLTDAYEAGETDFEFKSDIYGAKSVKNALIKAQHGKCAFCESKFEHIAYGDVEHFRPKGGFRQTEEDPLEQPGYFWLAYHWDNLFASCTLCNQRHKGNLFPLVDKAKRARSHQAVLADEEPLFLHSSDDDPEEYIGFHDEVPYAKDDDPRAEETIKSLGLRRPELNEFRRDYLRPLQLLANVAKTLESQQAAGAILGQELLDRLDEIHSHLEECRYASMARCALA